MCRKGDEVNKHEPLKISSWNINGYKSKNIGNKLLDRDFLDEIKHDALVGLVETHIYDEISDALSIPGFNLLTHKNRAFNKGSKKGDGGIAIFIKEKFSKHIVPQKNENPESVWVKIKKEFSGENDDIFIGTVYLAPYKSKSEDAKKMQEIEEEIFKFNQLGKVVIQGDFNARSGIERDFVIPDKFDLMPDLSCKNTILERNSEDRATVDSRGRELVDICKAMGVIMLNGRKTGDFFGKYTCFQWNGSSTVDYVLVKEALYDQVVLFKVGKFIPWISDHCATHFQISFKRMTGIEKEIYPVEKN